MEGFRPNNQERYRSDHSEQIIAAFENEASRNPASEHIKNVTKEDPRVADINEELNKTLKDEDAAGIFVDNEARERFIADFIRTRARREALKSNT